MSQKGLAPILIVVLITVVVGGYLIYINYSNNQYKTIPTQQATKPSTTSMQPVTQSSQVSTPVPLPAQTGVDLESIKYTLPSGWKAEISKDSNGRHTLYISPNTEPGLLAVHVYDYPNNIGRREYYCKITDFCIQGTTYFTQTQIGNIPGYKALALDNSGGGSEYFGAKGNKFYVIGRMRDITSTSDEFNKHFKEVLNSLIF